MHLLAKELKQGSREIQFKAHQLLLTFLQEPSKYRENGEILGRQIRLSKNKNANKWIRSLLDLKTCVSMVHNENLGFICWSQGYYTMFQFQTNFADVGFYCTTVLFHSSSIFDDVWHIVLLCFFIYIFWRSENILGKQTLWSISRLVLPTTVHVNIYIYI